MLPIDIYLLFLSLLNPQQLSLTKNEYHIYTIRGLTTKIFSFFKRGILVKIGINIKEILTNNFKKVRLWKYLTLFLRQYINNPVVWVPGTGKILTKKLFTEMSVDLQLMISKKSNYMFILLFNANNSCKCFTCVRVKIQRYT